MKKYIIKIQSLILLAFTALPIVALAETDPRTNLNRATPGLISSSGNIYTLIGRIIQGALGLLGVILVVLIVYAGFMWMTAGGDATKVQKAKSIIYQAVIGTVITLSAYIISFYVISEILKIK